MSIENTSRIKSFLIERKKKYDLDLALRKGGSTVIAKKRSTARYFRLKEAGLWVDDGCGKCHGGMSKELYDFQKENRPEGPICSGCSKKADRKAERDEALRKDKEYELELDKRAARKVIEI